VKATDSRRYLKCLASTSAGHGGVDRLLPGFPSIIDEETSHGRRFRFLTARYAPSIARISRFQRARSKEEDVAHGEKSAREI